MVVCIKQAIFAILFVNFPFQTDCKKPWSSKSMRRLTKSEADMKVYVFPCSVNLEEEKFLNSTMSANKNHLRNCKRKLVIKLTVNSGGEFCTKSDGFIPIDHVIDGVNGRKKRLLNPLMIRIKREKMYQLYDLQLIKSINAEATEEVLNYENVANFTGCDTSSSHPTCGFSFYNNKMIQYSEGFCCSCDQAKNDQRQPCEGRHGEEKSGVQQDQHLYTKHETSSGSRASRDLDSISSGDKDLEAGNHNLNDVISFEVINHGELKRNDDLKGLEEPVLSKELVNDLPENSLKNAEGIESLRKPVCDDSLTLDPNVTIRAFQFEHTPGPLRTLYTLKSLDFAVKTNDNDSKSKLITNRPNEKNIPGAFKMLMMNKIKVKKIDEKLHSPEVTSTVTISSVSCSNEQLAISNTPVVVNDQQISNQLSSKLESDRIEASIQVSPNNLSVLEKVDSRDSTSASYVNDCETSTVCTKEAPLTITACTESSDAEKMKVMEQVIQKLLPLLDSPNATIDYENIGKKELTTGSTGDCLVNRHEDDSGSASVLFSLNNQKVSNTSTNLPDLTVLKQSVGDEPGLKIEKREATDKQIRGGQSCCQKNAKLPCNADPDTYFESAHCLRFSDLWYNVHKLANPKMENTITIKIYAKHKTLDRRICWENLTKRLSGKVGTSSPVLVDDTKNLLITYTSDDKVAFSLDCANDFLLVPQPLPKKCRSSELSQLSAGGPKEYLVLKENDITFDGEECDKAGVTYATFARQSHRCQREAGSCLKNQPLQFWREDKKAESDGKQGQYFLDNFVTVTEQAILQNTTSNQIVLKAPYYKSYQSHVVVEMNADHIEIISDRSEGQITEIYIDATSDKVTIVKAVVTNLGIAAESFGVEFVNCSSPLGPSDFDRPGRDEIPPQHRITYTATISSPNLKKETTCTMAVLNVDQEVVASRKITVVRGERCMCVWHCQCVCHNHPHPGLPCTPLSLQAYNRAGFPGHLPVLSYAECGLLFAVIQGARWFFFILLMLGVLKAILGICLLPVRVFGLWFICPSAARCLDSYLEPELTCFPVTRDCDGFAIHPRTHKRAVRFLPWFWEFFCNCVFFVCAFRIWICRMCCSHRWCSQGFDDDFGYKPFPQKGMYSPGYSGRYGNGSPCGSPCSSPMRNMRLAAGGDSQVFEPDALAANRDDVLAQKRVEELLRSYHVFRNFSRPVGGVQSVPGTPYCVQGYFLESETGSVYEFSPSSPLMQIWQMDGSLLEPPKVLDSAPFHATYRNAREVLEARDLSPWARGVVINVL